MVDRAAIFTEITQRNALRKAAQLPVIDVPGEYQEAVARALHLEWEKRRASEIAAIWEDEKTRYRARTGHEPYGMLNGDGLVSAQANKRIAALRSADGVSLPVQRHQIIYRSDRKENE